MVKIVPGILEADFEAIKEKLAGVEDKFDWVQIDFLDNTLLPNQSYTDLHQFQDLITPAKLELHLMVDWPTKYLVDLPSPPFKRVVSHIEAKEPFELFLTQARERDLEVGVALDWPTPVEVSKPFINRVDLVLIMTARAGFSGQRFAEETLKKISLIRSSHPELPIEVDGGMSPETVEKAVRAGATHIVSTSYLFKTGSQKTLDEFQRAATQAGSLR